MKSFNRKLAVIWTSIAVALAIVFGLGCMRDSGTPEPQEKGSQQKPQPLNGCDFGAICTFPSQCWWDQTSQSGILVCIQSTHTLGTTCLAGYYCDPVNTPGLVPGCTDANGKWLVCDTTKKILLVSNEAGADSGSDGAAGSSGGAGSDGGAGAAGSAGSDAGTADSDAGTDVADGAAGSDAGTDAGSDGAGGCSGGPANNCFANAATLSGSATVVTTGATTETGEPLPCGSMGATVWYTWIAPGSGTATVTTVNASTDYDTVLAAYTGSALTSLTTLACNDDFGAGLQSQVTFTCTPGITYRIQVGGYQGDIGKAVVSVSGCTGTDAGEAGADAGQCPATTLDVACVQGNYGCLPANVAFCINGSTDGGFSTMLQCLCPNVADGNKGTWMQPTQSPNCSNTCWGSDGGAGSDSGSDGAAGSSGAAGAAGSDSGSEAATDGSAGAAGSAGSSGSDAGSDGTGGAAGSDGGAGAAGSSGSAGSAGSAGSSGSDAGADATGGSGGSAGADAGADGAGGSAGSDGGAGAAGSSGAAGSDSGSEAATDAGSKVVHLKYVAPANDPKGVPYPGGAIKVSGFVKDAVQPPGLTCADTNPDPKVVDCDLTYPSDYSGKQYWFSIGLPLQGAPNGWFWWEDMNWSSLPGCPGWGGNGAPQGTATLTYGSTTLSYTFSGNWAFNDPNPAVHCEAGEMLTYNGVLVLP